MMTADEILAAHARRTPSRFRDEDAVRAAPPPWWEVDASIGGDLRAYLRKTKKETEEDAENARQP